jgi:hypothetical protein
MRSSEKEDLKQQRAEALRFLRRCFTEEEWRLLIEKPQFRTFLTNVQKFEDAETAIEMAVHLIIPEQSCLRTEAELSKVT